MLAKEIYFLGSIEIVPKGKMKDKISTQHKHRFNLVLFAQGIN